MILKTTHLDIINIGLLLISSIIAVVIPFELFLISYGILGPLHYLTEISWLHDKNYFAINRNNSIFLVAMAIVITLISFKDNLGLDSLEISSIYINRAIFIAFVSSIFIAVVKSVAFRIIGIGFTILASSLSDQFFLLFSVFLPTLIHVLLFTCLFMLYGSLKTKSTIGYASVLLLVAIPFILYFLTTDTPSTKLSTYVQTSYQNFESLNLILIQLIGNQKASKENYLDLIYHSKLGISIMRIIAFSYTYHYLNWFSKTKIIQWHAIPTFRAVAILLLWFISLLLYGIDYSLGFIWLFILSFMHVLLEFPLNVKSAIGVYHELKEIMTAKMRIGT